jgi:hypothetical protein
MNTIQNLEKLQRKLLSEATAMCVHAVPGFRANGAQSKYCLSFERKKRKSRTVIILSVIAVVCLSGRLSAQTVYWGNVSTGRNIGTQSAGAGASSDSRQAYMEKIAENRYRQPGSAVTYNIEGYDFWMRYDDAPEADVKLGSYRRSGDRVLYYKDENIAGYYTPADSRYYMAVSEGDNILKEAHIGVLASGKLYSGEGEDQIRFSVGDGFDPIALGMFLILQ